MASLSQQVSVEPRLEKHIVHWAEGLGDPSVPPQDNYFLAGGILTGKVTLTPQGWRITYLANDVIWRKGTGFQQILQTQ